MELAKAEVVARVANCLVVPAALLDPLSLSPLLVPSPLIPAPVGPSARLDLSTQYRPVLLDRSLQYLSAPSALSRQFLLGLLDLSPPVPVARFLPSVLLVLSRPYLWVLLDPSLPVPAARFLPSVRSDLSHQYLLVPWPQSIPSPLLIQLLPSPLLLLFAQSTLSIQSSPSPPLLP